MTAYLARRLLQTVALLFLLSIVLFALVNLAPGEAANEPCDLPDLTPNAPAGGAEVMAHASA